MYISIIHLLCGAGEQLDSVIFPVRNCQLIAKQANALHSLELARRRSPSPKLAKALAVRGKHL
jgi:hypothetical protein